MTPHLVAPEQVSEVMTPPKPNTCNTWAVNLDTVLHVLQVDGVESVTIKLDGQPDSRGHVKLIVEPVKAAEPTNPTPSNLFREMRAAAK